MNTFPLNFGPDGAGDGRFHRAASGECILDGGAVQFQGYDEDDKKSLNGRLTGENKVLRSAGEIACKCNPPLGSDSRDVRLHMERVVSWYRGQGFILAYIEGNIFHFYLSKEAKSTENNTVNSSQQPGNEDGSAVRSQVQRKH